MNNSSQPVTTAARQFQSRRQLNHQLTQSALNSETVAVSLITSVPATPQQLRGRRLLILGFFALLFAAVIGKLFYTQVVNGADLKAKAERQYFQPYQTVGQRGKIYTNDGALLVGNQDNFRFFIDNKYLKESLNQSENDQGKQPDYQAIAAQVTPILHSQYSDTTPEELQNTLYQKLIEQQDRNIINLAGRISPQLKEQLQGLGQDYFGFDAFTVRAYPEASLAAQIVGYVAKNDIGLDTGYAGIEGALDKELQGRTAQKIVEVDALQKPLTFQTDLSLAAADGRDVYLTIRRDIQNYLEDSLAQGLEKYGAAKGEIIVMDPKTGNILGWATLPSYSPDQFSKFEPHLLHNPSLADQFEPGSTFKVVTVAAGIDTGKITPYTPCPKCTGPREVAGYSIKTWNEVYNPNIDMTTALEKSDNTAMVYVSDLLGTDKFKEYLERFGFGQPIGFEMQEDQKTLFPSKWGPVELATRSFGQGIMVNSMQMMRAVGAIANDGKMMQPQIVARVIDNETGEEFVTQPQVVAEPISPATATTVTEMMIASAKHGEAQWVYKDSDIIAGKTGTAQIPDLEHGGYKKDETLASFIGFAPAQDPQFVMLVKLTAPKSSPWAAETAAPLWNKVAEKLFILLGVDVASDQQL